MWLNSPWSRASRVLSGTLTDTHFVLLAFDMRAFDRKRAGRARKMGQSSEATGRSESSSSCLGGGEQPHAAGGGRGELMKETQVEGERLGQGKENPQARGRSAPGLCTQWGAVRQWGAGAGMWWVRLEFGGDGPGSGPSEYPVRLRSLAHWALGCVGSLSYSGIYHCAQDVEGF